MRRTLLAILLLCLLTPVSQAGLFRGAQVHVAPVRAGDVLRYEITEPAAVLGDRSPTDTLWFANLTTVVVQAVGPGRAADAFGIEHDVSLFVVQRQSDEGNRPVKMDRCALLAGGNETVRAEPLLASSSTYWTARDWTYEAGIGNQVKINGNLLAEYPTEPCPGADPLAGATLHEGDRLRLDALEAPVAGLGHSTNLSEPAQARTFHGRAALALDYPNGGSRVEILYADGLPGPVSVIAYAPNGTRALSWELAAIHQTDGAALPPDEGARLEQGMPGARVATPPPTSLDDSWLTASYHYADALTAARMDPRTGLDAWMNGHADATLRLAWYDAGMPDSLPQARSEGGWQLIFDAPGAEAWAQTVQLQKVGAPLAPSVRDSMGSTYDPRLSLGPRPSPMLDGVSLAAALRAHHVEPGGVRDLLLTRIGGSQILLASELSSFDTQQPAGEGRFVVLDATSGRAFAEVAQRATVQSASPLRPPSPESGLAAASVAPLAVPSLGAGLGLAAVAATGLALLVVALLPLYTRLRRERLLDHPVRARLYEHARAHPSVHLAELVELAGLGRSTTKHHLDQLVNARILVELADDGRTRYYAAGEVPPDIARREALLREGSYQRVYELYRAAPALSLREAARRLDLAAPTVFRAKRRLEKAGLLPAGENLSSPVSLADA